MHFNAENANNAYRPKNLHAGGSGRRVHVDIWEKAI